MILQNRFALIKLKHKTMKKFILPLMSIFVLFSCSEDDVQTPIETPLVITKEDYNTNYRVGGTKFAFFNAENSAVSIPNPGENQTWDFSALTEIFSVENGGEDFLTPSNAAFPSATYAYASQSSYNVSGFASDNYDTTYFVEVSENGAYNLGFSQDEPATLYVASLDATFSYGLQNRTYAGNAKYPSVIFPAKMGNAPVTVNDIKDTSNFTVTAAAFGLSNVPGQTTFTTDLTLEIFASGTANLKGIGTKRVLVVKTSYTQTTNYFLGGAPAPAMLLANLGVTDGAATTGTTYRFIAEGLGTVGLIEVNDLGQIYFASFRKAIQ